MATPSLFVSKPLAFDVDSWSEWLNNALTQALTCLKASPEDFPSAMAAEVPFSSSETAENTIL